MHSWTWISRNLHFWGLAKRVGTVWGLWWATGPATGWVGLAPKKHGDRVQWSDMTWRVILVKTKTGERKHVKHYENTHCSSTYACIIMHIWGTKAYSFHPCLILAISPALPKKLHSLAYSCKPRLLIGESSILVLDHIKLFANYQIWYIVLVFICSTCCSTYCMYSSLQYAMCWLLWCPGTRKLVRITHLCYPVGWLVLCCDAACRWLPAKVPISPTVRRKCTLLLRLHWEAFGDTLHAQEIVWNYTCGDESSEQPVVEAVNWRSLLVEVSSTVQELDSGKGDSLEVSETEWAGKPVRSLGGAPGYTNVVEL